MTNKWFSLTAMGLGVNREPTIKEWEETGIQLGKETDKGNWAIGDWLVEGAKLRAKLNIFPNGVYAEASRLTGYSAEYLTIMYKVCRDFAPQDRKIGLTLGHHYEVMIAAKEDRSHYLDLARAKHWSVPELRHYIETQREETPAEKKARTEALMQCPSCAHVFPARGNKVAATLAPRLVRGAATEKDFQSA